MSHKLKYYIILIEPSTRMLETLSVLKDLCGMGLGDGKRMCETVPCVVKEAMDLTEAEALVKYLTDNGAKAKLQSTEYYLYNK